MAQEQAKQFLQQGIAAARAGRPDIARDILQQAIRLDPQNETTWLWLSSVARDDKERLFCLKQILTINPQNEFALKGLRALGVQTAGPAAPTAPTSTIPTVSDDKYGRIQQAVDDFLRRYNPEPDKSTEITWGKKTKRRYGEGGAQRLRQVTYAAAALLIVVVVGGGVFLLSTLTGGSDSEGTPVAVNATRTPVTPTLTPTPTIGGPTPTGIRINGQTPTPSQPPAGLVVRGNAYSAPEPTEIRPTLNPFVRGQIAKTNSNAVALYSNGQYQEALAVLENAHQYFDQNQECYASLVYYEALTQVALDNIDQAERLLEQAQNYQMPPNSIRGEEGYESCRMDAPLLLTALGHIRFLQGQYDEALVLSQQALDQSPALVQASVTKARVLLIQEQYTEALNTLRESPAWNEGDTNLLVVAAEAKLSDMSSPANNARDALGYIAQALYVEPLCQPALQLQTRAYLQLAAVETDPGKQQEYYGWAVLSAQTLWLHYASDPAAYLYLAEARIGEQNTDMAETELTRVINAGLPDTSEAQNYVEAAYRLRGELYYADGRLNEALMDFEKIVNSTPRRDEQHLDLLGKLLDISLRLEQYLGDNGADGWVARLIAADPENAKVYLLQRARLYVETCTFVDELDCEYEEMLDVLDNEILIDQTGLSPEQIADASSYRAQARYYVTTEGRGDDEEQQTAYLQALADINQALAVRETALDHYYRGLILEGLGDESSLSQALREYQWVVYWNTTYAYPFVDEAFEDRMADLTERIENIASTPEPTEEAPEATEEASTAATEEAPDGATATPRPTNTPTDEAETNATATPPPLP